MLRRVGKSGLLRLVEEDWAGRHPDRPRLLIEKELADWAELRTGDEPLAQVHALEGHRGHGRTPGCGGVLRRTQCKLPPQPRAVLRRFCRHLALGQAHRRLSDARAGGPFGWCRGTR